MFIAENKERFLVAALSVERVLVSENCANIYHACKVEPGMRLCVSYAPLTLMPFSDICPRRTLETHAPCCSARSCGGRRLFSKTNRRCRIDEKT